jgi:transcriptional regulator with XRE-family HTH domain
MLNPDDFIKRLEFIMEHFGLSASSFADKISVQRSSISHLLSGRNKPSLDFVLKILDIFPELNLYWLLEGTGSYLQNDAQEITSKELKNTATLFSEDDEKETKKMTSTEDIIESKIEQPASHPDLFSHKQDGRQLEKIVFFYTDGTFQDYKPASQK